jgi:hypothetical protein
MRAPALLIMALLSISSSGVRADEQWSEFRSTEGRFTILFPGQPEFFHLEPDQDGVVEHIFVVNRHRSAYRVSYLEFPSGIETDTNADEFCHRMLYMTAIARLGSLRASRIFTLNGHPACESILDSADGEYTTIARIYLVANRMYLNLAAGKRGFDDDADSARFHDSFRLLGQ